MLDIIIKKNIRSNIKCNYSIFNNKLLYYLLYDINYYWIYLKFLFEILY